ncbi:MAG: hypothetical protein HA496_00540 [Thaumarchaeota archaeon]|jgi:hypothetical protein|nr:hypothetical protein [Nitrososphaerota archaeon]
MREERLYDPVGEWLIREKGCQRDKYSQGYLKDAQIGNFRFDVLGIRYEVVHECINHLDFHGYIVEVKGDETGLDELIGKVMMVKEGIKGHSIIEHFSGLDTVELYIAYPTEQVKTEILRICEREGIGILRLQIVDEKTVHVYNVGVKPELIYICGISHEAQKSPGNFESAMNEFGYLRQMFQRPSDMFEDLIRPSKEEYNAQLKLKELQGYVRNKESEEALDFLIEKIQEKLPQVNITSAGGKIAFILHGTELLNIVPTTKYFYVQLGEGERYRILSRNEIIGFEGSVDNLIDSVIIPYINDKIKKR